MTDALIQIGTGTAAGILSAEYLYKQRTVQKSNDKEIDEYKKRNQKLKTNKTTKK